MSPVSPPRLPISFVLFDLDGTLVDTLEDIAASVNHALRTLGLPERSLEEVRTFVGRGVQHLVLRAIGSENAEKADRLLDLFRAHYDAHCLDRSRLMPGARECLEYFAGRDLGVVSNKPERFVRRLLEGLGIDSYFKVMFGGDSTAERKPSPLMVRAALGTLGRSPNEGILAGDLPVDVETGRAAGVYTVALLGGFGTREELEASSPDLLLDDLHMLVRRFG
ncbi:MAG: HAD-IA family hydrolase [Candidatus Eisenbacteria bacterium]|nr:HAD-IA family hydrolase [Candidatus Eisenbacteria bacterium]